MTSYALENLRQRLLASLPDSACFGFQGLRAADSVTVEHCLSLDFLVACDWGLDGPQWDKRLRYFAVERPIGKRIVWTHRSIVDAYTGSWGDELRKYLTQGDQPRIIIPYRSTEFLEQLSDDTSGRVSIIANPLHLKNQFDDKVAFRQEAGKRGIPVPPGEILPIGDLSEALLQKWGPQLILSERVGSSGNQTYLIETPEELRTMSAQLKNKSGKDELIIANRFLKGPAIGITAFIFHGKPHLSKPSAMITGLKGCSMHRFDYAGSDFGAISNLPDSAMAQVEKATLDIGSWAADFGYKGIFGVDFVIHEGIPYALELNPRLLGTTQLMTELELRQSPAPSSIFWHLADLVDAEVPEHEASHHFESLVASTLEGFQLLLRNTYPYPVRIGRALQPGVYVMEGQNPRYVREGDRISDLNTPDEILLTCSPPPQGTEVAPRGAFFKLEGLGRILDEAVENVTLETVQMIASFTQSLQLSKCHGEGSI